LHALFGEGRPAVSRALDDKYSKVNRDRDMGTVSDRGSGPEILQ